MATSKKRVNISISKEMDRILASLAKRDQMPLATKAEHLIRFALELEEDRVLSEIAERLDVPGVKYLSHEEAWK